jgi:hypothetical protein
LACFSLNVGESARFAFAERLPPERGSDVMTGNTMRLIIDRDGSVWSAYDEKLVERWGYPDPDFDLPSFAVRNLGAIDVTVDEEQITLKFRWLTVKSDALGGVLQLLGQLPPRPVSVHCETETWTEQSFLDPGEAINWITANRTLWVGNGAVRSVVTSPRQLNALSDRSLSRIEDSEDRLALMFKKWRLVQGLFSEDVVNFFVRFGMLDRAFIARKRDDGSVVFEHVGPSITLYNRGNPDWTYTATGRPVVDQPDRAYGRWTESMFNDALARRTPTFDHVDAVVRDGSGASRFRYDRLLLPWTSSDQVDILTGLSFKTNPDSMMHA